MGVWAYGIYDNDNADQAVSNLISPKDYTRLLEEVPWVAERENINIDRSEGSQLEANVSVFDSVEVNLRLIATTIFTYRLILSGYLLGYNTRGVIRRPSWIPRTAAPVLNELYKQMIGISSRMHQDSSFLEAFDEELGPDPIAFVEQLGRALMDVCSNEPLDEIPSAEGLTDTERELWSRRQTIYRMSPRRYEEIVYQGDLNGPALRFSDFNSYEMRSTIDMLDRRYSISKHVLEFAEDDDFFIMRVATAGLIGMQDFLRSSDILSAMDLLDRAYRRIFKTRTYGKKRSRYYFSLDAFDDPEAMTQELVNEYARLNKFREKYLFSYIEHLYSRHTTRSLDFAERFFMKNDYDSPDLLVALIDDLEGDPTQINEMMFGAVNHPPRTQNPYQDWTDEFKQDLRDDSAGDPGHLHQEVTVAEKVEQRLLERGLSSPWRREPTVILPAHFSERHRRRPRR